MSYTINEEKLYPVSIEVLSKAILGSVEGLEGKVLYNDPNIGRIVAKFNKTIHGKVLGDRSQVEIDLIGASPEETKMVLAIYPINPIGQKLEFGARKGVSRTVLSWLYAHIDHRLKIKPLSTH